jgi:hypothetical protein
MDFQINGTTYFLSLAEDRGWQVFVSTPEGSRELPVYDEAAEFEETPVLTGDRRKRHILN